MKMSPQILRVMYNIFYKIKKYINKTYYTSKLRQQAKDVGDNFRVNGPSRLSPQSILGDNVKLNGMEVRGDGYFEIGDNFRSAPGCVVITRNHNYYTSDAVPYDETYVRDDVIIHDNVWLGVNVTIVPGVEISEGAIVQADSTVVNDVPRCAIVGGHPAEVISYRDIEHYEKLKNKDRFVPPSA